jgi:hypothetical protein
MGRIRNLSCYRERKDASQTKRAVSLTLRRELSSSFTYFPARQGTERNYTNLRETMGEYVPSYATVKRWVAQFKRMIFPTVLLLVLDDLKQ